MSSKWDGCSRCVPQDGNPNVLAHRHSYDPSLLPDYGGPNEELLPPLSAWDAYPEEPETIEVVEYRVVRAYTYEEGVVNE